MDLKNFKIRPAILVDIPLMVALSYQKRLNYQEAQPQFWRHAKNAEDIQCAWFKELLGNDDHILLVAEVEQSIHGFIIGKLTQAPEVYDPGGMTLIIDDFCVKDPDFWESIGIQLLSELKQRAIKKGAVQLVAVCGNHDKSKMHFLSNANLEVASNWFVGKL